MTSSLIRSFLVRIHLVGLTCLVASTLTIGAVANAEPNVSPGTDVAEPAEGTNGTEAGRTSSSAPDGDDHAKSNRHDELCSWGRLSDGHGKLVRCLTGDEARTLANTAKRDTGTGADPAMVKSEEPTAIVGVVRRVVFEGESISTAKQHLTSLVPEYQSCIAHHGGLRREAGEVRIRFHVDSRGVAREPSVSRRRFVSVQAARCVAGIVGHRFVEAPKSKATVGTVVIQFARNAR